MENLIFKKLSSIETLLLDNKKVLNIDELAKYTSYSKSTIYKMVQGNIIPFSKPNGKHLFFDKEEIDDWLLSNKSKSKLQLQNEALNYANSKK